jgi:dicarboxylate/amino acid:cation (Na+ or H+) symporter, DAACS family
MGIFKTQHARLLLGLLAGLLAGLLLHPYADNATLLAINKNVLQPIGQIFLRLIFMVVVPMIFSALVIGVFDLGTQRGLGKMMRRTVFYTVVASAISVAIGITLVNGFQPGNGLQVDAALVQQQSADLETLQKNAAAAKPLAQTLVDLFPKNPLDSAARALEGEMLALMFFALLFGFALSRIANPQEESNPLIRVLDQVYHACLKIVDYAMLLAPLAVFALVFNTVFTFGYGILLSLLGFVLVVIAGLLLQQFVVYAALLRFVARRSPVEFFVQCREVYLYAFSTASSNATLPRSLETAEEKLGLPPQIARFVLTIGSTANQNGTALFEGVTVLFLAQVYGVDLSLAQQVQVVLMSILAGIGTAGVPGGSLPLIVILLQSVGIPAEGMGLILGVDRLLDMARTTLNVSGDLVIAALVSTEPGPPAAAPRLAPA